MLNSQKRFTMKKKKMFYLFILTSSFFFFFFLPLSFPRKYFVSRPPHSCVCVGALLFFRKKERKKKNPCARKSHVRGRDPSSSSSSFINYIATRPITNLFAFFFFLSFLFFFYYHYYYHHRQSHSNTIRRGVAVLTVPRAFPIVTAATT